MRRPISSTLEEQDQVTCYSAWAYIDPQDPDIYYSGSLGLLSLQQGTILVCTPLN